MRRSVLVSIVAACGGAPMGGVDEEPIELPLCADAPLALDDALADAVAGNDGRGGGLLRVASRECVWFDGAAGSVARGGDALAPGDAFELASVTKTFTAVLAMTFVEDGTFALDDTFVDAWGPARPRASW